MKAVAALLLGTLTAACGAGATITQSGAAPARAQAITSLTGVVRFLASGEIERQNALRTGGVLRVEYPIERLPTCRHTHNGFPAWNLDAHVLFQPSGEQREGTVRAFEAPNGVPNNNAYAVPFETTIPEGTSSVEIWFVNANGADSQCRAYDSNLGANYIFNVQRPVEWLGSPTVLLSRDTAQPCGTASLDGGFTYDTWVRQRAAMRNVCFEVWQPGVTDLDRPDVWELIDAQLLFRFAASDEWQSMPAQYIARREHNALYAVDLRAIDPFRPNRCTSEPTHPSTNGQYVDADVELKLVANGNELAGFRGTFQDYSVTPCAP